MTSVPAGPFETEDDARTDPATRAARGSGDVRAASYAMLDGACSSSGVRTGDYDRSVLYWLAGFEPQVCAAVAGIIRRAFEAGQLASAPGALGYLVAWEENGKLRGTTHCTPMTLEEARREAQAHEAAPYQRWLVAGLREADGA